MMGLSNMVRGFHCNIECHFVEEETYLWTYCCRNREMAYSLIYGELLLLYCCLIKCHFS